jgi:hypothetical protein
MAMEDNLLNVGTITLETHTAGESGNECFAFVLSPSIPVPIPNVGDRLQLPGMTRPEQIKSRDFIYHRQDGGERRDLVILFNQEP